MPIRIGVGETPLFIPVQAAYNITDAGVITWTGEDLDDEYGIALPMSKDSFCRGVGLASIAYTKYRVIVNAPAAGDVDIKIDLYAGPIGTDGVGYVDINDDEIATIVNAYCYTSVLEYEAAVFVNRPGDYVIFKFTRNGTEVTDTLAHDLHVIGVELYNN